MTGLPDYDLLEPSVLPFVAIPVLLAIALTLGVAAAWRRAARPPARILLASLITLALSILWMDVTWSLAMAGVFADWDRTPPPFAGLVLAVFLLAFAIAFSGVGARLAALPVWTLVAVQSFRFPLELAMHRMYERGITPAQMSYSGRNFDIITGITAIAVAALVWSGRGGLRLVAVWNVLGLGLLLNVIGVAILSMPRFAFFGPDRLNVWVAYPPFVWLPAVMVLAALAGHLIVFRALARRNRPLN